MSKRNSVTIIALKSVAGAFVAALLYASAGCVSHDHLSSDFGATVRHNQYAQLVDPNAGETEALPATLDGQRAETVMDRYRKEKQETEKGRLLEDISSQ